jgi:hypothetical protein
MAGILVPHCGIEWWAVALSVTGHALNMVEQPLCTAV